jgi:hypothetical protein
MNEMPRYCEIETRVAKPWMFRTIERLLPWRSATWASAPPLSKVNVFPFFQRRVLARLGGAPVKRSRTPPGQMAKRMLAVQASIPELQTSVKGSGGRSVEWDRAQNAQDGP